MFKKSKKEEIPDETLELPVPIPARPVSGAIREEFTGNFDVTGQVNVESQETNDPYSLIVNLANQQEKERPKKFYKNNVALWTPGGIKSLAWFVNGTDSEGPVKQNTKGETIMTPKTKCLCTTLGLALVFLIAIFATIVFSTTEEDQGRSVFQGTSTPTFAEIPVTGSPVTVPVPNPTPEPEPTAVPTTLAPTQEPTKFPTVTPAPTPLPTVQNSNRCAGITDDTRWKFCFDAETLGKCEFVNGEGRQIGGETDCLTKSDDRHFCRCPDGFLFLETFGCTIQENVGDGCVSLAMVQAGFVLADSEDVV